MNQRSYRDLIAGTDGGFATRLLRRLLRIVSVIYAVGVCLRNWCYDKRLLKSFKVDAEVISVGNITAGGTGKTPLVIWLCRKLHRQGVRCAVLTRGYKVQDTDLSDEPAMLAKACPNAEVIVDADRVRGAKHAIDIHSAQVLIMDDGFQHRRLRRTLDIVTIDATCPFGFEKLLPAGLLREPLTAISRADAIVITRCDQAEADEIENIERKIDEISHGVTVAKAVHKPHFAKMLKGESLTIDQLKERKIIAFCGIGNPDAFLKSLEDLGLNILASKVYNDHHEYTEQDVSDLYEEGRKLEADLVLSTQKDWVKMALLSQRYEDIAFAYLAVELEFIDGVDRMEALLDWTTDMRQASRED